MTHSLLAPKAPVRAFLKTRAARWQTENLASNPQEQWRVRPRNVRAQPLLSFALGDAPVLQLSRAEVSSTVRAVKPMWCFCSPEVKPLSLALARWVTPRVFFWYNLVTYAPVRRAVLKLKYKGKSFRWHRRRRSLLLRFGHSHLVFCTPLPWVKSRKHGRMKIIFWGTNAWYLKKFLQAAIR